VTDRIQQVLFGPSMRIVAGNARFLTRLDALMGGEELRGALVMTLGTERTAGHDNKAWLV